MYFVVFLLCQLYCFSGFRLFPRFSKKPAAPIQNGFFGTIGPNLRPTEIKSLAELFMGDGVIQGVFFRNGTPTFARHLVKTRKVKAGENDNLYAMLSKYLLYKAGMYPYNTIGVANTALMAVSKPVDENTTALYALYERDLPYLVYLYHNTSTIETITQMDTFFPAIQEFSGHSKIAQPIDAPKVIEPKAIEPKAIETINYHIGSNKLDFYRCNEKLNAVLSEKTVKMKYIPIVHDFISTPTTYIALDSPFIYDFFRILRGKIPLVFDANRPSFFHVINKSEKKMDTYECPRGYYIFHYADCEETADAYIIYAPVYESLDFSELNIEGKYRKLVLDKISKKVNIQYDTEIERMNLDFPIKGPNGTILLRSIENRRANGFVMMDGLRIKQKWLYDDVFFIGEHVVVGNNLMAFCIKQGMNYLAMLNLDTDTIDFLACSYDLTMGFHSTFILL